MTEHRAGLVGLGLMGAPMSQHVLAAGMQLTCFDLDPEALREAERHGARTVDTPAAVADSSDVSVVVVPTDDDVREVCLGEQGLLSAASAGSVVVICSSVTPRTCREVAEAAATRGVEVLDAPLTGGIRGAERGDLTLLVGGEPAALEKARPVLDTFSQKLHVLGPVGAGQVGKTVNNVIHWGEIVVITEALALGAELGLDVSTLRPALSDASVDSRTLRELHTMRFTWPEKDLANAFDMAEEVGAPLPAAHLARERMQEITPGRVARLLAGQGWNVRDDAPDAE